MPTGLSSHRERHLRAISYVLVSLVLAVVGYTLLGFDRTQTVGYAAAIYVFLNVLNFRVMFSRQDRSDEPHRGGGPSSR
jgi:hypothetical protein